MGGNHAARAEKHLADLKAQLKITPQQEPLWQAFADKLKSAMGGMRPMSDASQPATAPERMNRMVEHMKQHTAAMEGVSDSFKRLYDALTPEQKAVADKYHPFGEHMGKRGPGGKMGGRMGGQMGGQMGGMGPGGQRGSAPDAAPAR
jgi:hypothetical protein